MNKHLLFLLFFLNSILISAQCLVLEDDFETGTIEPHWIGLTNLFQIDSINAGSGSYHLTSNADFPSIYDGLSFDFPEFSPNVFAFKIKSSNTNLTGSGTIILGDSLTNGQISSTGNGGLFFINFFNGSLRIIGDTAIAQPAVDNFWYDVLIDDFNWFNQTADIYINGVLLGQNIGFRHNMTGVSKIILSGGTQNNNNLTYSSWDMIHIASTPTIIDIDTTICYGDSYTFTDGHVIQNITSDTNYNSILIGPGICDIITNTVIHLRHNHFQFNTDSIYHCVNQNGNGALIEVDTNFAQYIWSDSSALPYYTSSTNQWVHLQVLDTLGCYANDSVFTELISVDTTIHYTPTNINGGLYTNETEATFQWLDCNNSLTALNNETMDTIHFPIASGDFHYALEINKKGCIDTTSCHRYLIFSDGISNIDKPTIGPNPFKDYIKIYNEKENIDLILYNSTGKLIFNKNNYINNNGPIDLSQLENGYYIMVIKSNESKTSYPLIKY